MPQFLWSQSFKNEADLIKQANEHFEEGRFVQALPLFSQLVSLNPKDADYNYKFGTCVIYSGVDRETAIKHLSFSTKRSVQDPRAYYYLGLAYHLNYEFQDAKKQYSTFLQKADEKTKEKFDTQRQIEMCTNGQSLLSSITDLVVLDKKEVSESDFFRYYNLDEIGGKIIAKPEALLTKRDKKKGLSGVVHFDRNSDYIYYSSYGTDGDQLDLYRAKPLAEGKFSKPEKLKGTVNTGFDEDFAFMHADGESLYFASKGHSSMGGFDVFKATYNPGTDAYEQIENLDFAVNTPDDDLFYLVDSTKTMAYFASGRSSALENLHVYKVRVQSVPVNLVLIKGDFISQIDEQQKSTKISIVDDFTGMHIGEFYSDKSSGNYLIPFERSGTYKFEIEVENSPLIHEGIVEIPSFDSVVALKQELILSKENGVEKLQINNYFEEVLDEDIAMLTQEILRKKAGLDVNADEMTAVLEQQIQEEEELLETARPVSDAGVVAGFSEDLTIQDISDQMKSQAEAYDAESDRLQSRTQEAYAESQIKSELAQEELIEGKRLIAAADKSNPDEYIRMTNEGNALLAKSKEHNLEAQSLLEVVKAVSDYSEELKQTSSTMKGSADIVRSSQDFEEVVTLLKAEKERERSVSKEDPTNPQTVINTAASFSDNELENLVARIDKLREEEADLERKIVGKNRTLEATTKRSKRETIEIEIQGLEDELELTKEELISESQKVEVLSYDAENYALQQKYLEQINSETHSFEGESTPFDRAQLDQEIAKVESDALEAIALMPEDAEQIASASEELKSRIELKSLQSKAGALDSGIELISYSELRSGFDTKRSALPLITDVYAAESRERVLNDMHINELKEQHQLIDELKASGVLSPDEQAYLEQEQVDIKAEIQELHATNSTSNRQLSPEDLETKIEEIVPEYASQLADWKSKEPSVNGLSEVDVITKQAVEKVDDLVSRKSAQLISSTDPAEIETLHNEIDELTAVSQHLKEQPFKKEFLDEVYAAELAQNPDRELELSKEYRSILEQKIIQLDEESQLASSEVKEENLRIKNVLSDQLTATGGTITRLEEETASEDTSSSEALSGTEEETLTSSEPSESTGDIAGVSDTQGEQETSSDNDVSSTLEEVTPVTSEGTTTEEIDLESTFNTPEELMSALSPEYSQELETIRSNELISDEEKIEFEKELNEELIANLDVAISKRVEFLDETEAETTKDKLQLQINQIQSFKEQKVAENSALDTQLEVLTASEGITEEDPNLTSVEEEPSHTIADNSGDTTRTTEGVTETENSSEGSTSSPVEQEQNTTVDNNEIIDAARSADEGSLETDITESTTDSSDSQSTEEEITSEEPTVSTDESATSSELNRLTEEEVAAEINGLSTGVKSAFVTQFTPAEQVEIEDLTSSEAYEDLMADHPELASKMKKQYQIDALSEDIFQYEAELAGATSEKEVKKLEKKIAKFEKKRAKLEVKNAPYIIDTAADEYNTRLAELDTQFSDEESNSEEQAYMAYAQKMRAAAEVYHEDAEIYKGLAESSDKDLLKQTELYQESAAKQLAAIQNLERAEWMLEHSEELAELSPETIDRMLMEESLLTETSSTPEVAPEVESEVTAMDEVLLTLDESSARSETLQNVWEVSDEEMAKIKTSSAYIAYESKSSELKNNIAELRGIQNEIETLKTQAESSEEEADRVEQSIDSVESEAEKEGLREEVKRLRASAQVSYAQIAELESNQETLLENSQSLQDELIALEATLIPEEMLAAAEATNAFSSGDVDLIYTKSLDLSNAVNESVFSRTKNVYSESRPIPVDVKLPEGLVYKVQVGAFRNAIPQTLYNEFAPVTGEKLTNGITRYTAGVFTSEQVANTAKTDIRGLGYADAFVVAYLNGERISLAEARRIGPSEQTSGQDILALNITETGNPTETVSTPSETSNPDTTVGSNTSSTTGSNTSSTSGEKTSSTSIDEPFRPTAAADDYYESYPDAAEANQIEVLSGLFYTVQVGVYSRPVPARNIFNISPLNSERLSNNNIRYTTGIYNNLDEAIRRKEQIQAIGVSDAFVTAYLNGKRISVSEAKQKFAEGGVELLEVAHEVADQQSENAASAPEEYVIYIGTFTNEVPANVAKAMLFLEESRGIVQKRNGEEVSYFTKPVKSRQTANIIKQEFESYEVYSVQIQKVGDSN